MKSKLRSLAIVVIIVISAIAFSQDIFAQTQRNPVLEEFTGTWCPWCPCGHTTMAQIKAAFPNAIMIGYHGPANGTDPFLFPVIQLLVCLACRIGPEAQLTEQVFLMIEPHGKAG